MNPPDESDLCPNVTFHPLDCDRLRARYPHKVLLLGISDRHWLVPVYREESWCEYHNTRTFGFLRIEDAQDFAKRHNGSLL